jgi:hypothetical protein
MRDYSVPVVVAVAVFLAEVAMVAAWTAKALKKTAR